MIQPQVEACHRDAAWHLLRAARCIENRHRNLCRPSVMLGAELSSYVCAVTGRTFWQASYDELIVTGETPDRAFAEFDRAWVRGTE